MPSSYVDSYAPIVHTLIGLEPTVVVDVGPGWGKYGLALREYVPSIKRLTAVEVEPGRLPVQDAIYDEVYTGDVRVWPSREFWAAHDLALLVDVIEHMPHSDGESLLARILDARCRVLVSTPKTFFEQNDPANPYEAHCSLWEWADFTCISNARILQDVSTIDSIIYVLGAAS